VLPGILHGRSFQGSSYMRAIRGILCRSWQAWGLLAILCAASSVMGAGTERRTTSPVPARHSLSAVGTESHSGSPAQKSSNPDANIPPGTILPIRLNSLSSEKNKKGDVIKARLMQDVPLGGGSKLRAGCRVLGRVIDVSPATSSKKAALSVEFDTVLCGKERLPVLTHIRALASTLEVEFAQIPTIGPGESDVYDWLPTTQVGGEIVYGKGGEVTNDNRVVGRSVNDGILAQANSKEGTKCQGPVEGNDQPQAFWVFSSDACGAYGFPNLTISHAGRTDPRGEIVLVSERGPVKIRSGSGMLLRVQR
jgi:hypothetical protein